MSLAIASSASRPRILSRGGDASPSGTLGCVPTILILEDDASTRDALAAMLGDLFPRAHVIGARVDAGPGVAERDVTLVLTELDAVERVRARLPAGALGIALTPEVGPDTLFRAQAPGLAAAVGAAGTPQRVRAG